MGKHQISLSGVLAKRNEIFQSGLSLADAFREFLSWLGEHENDLDSSASDYFDKILENAYKVAQENINKMPDTPENRQAKRKIAQGQGGHIATTKMIEAFEIQHGRHTKIIDDWSEILSKTHQAIADFTYDLSQNKESLQYSIVIITLLYGCIDELTVAHFLGRHFYFTQANGHLRTVLETLEKIELFIEQPQWIEVWANGKWNVVQKELGPSGVRKKLGRDGFDPLYGYLCNNGTHPSYEALKNHTYLDGKKENLARVFVGGTPFVHLQIFHFQISLVISNLLLSRMVKLFSNALNFDESEAILKESAGDFRKFIDEYLAPWAAENKLDISELQKLFDNLKL